MTTRFAGRAALLLVALAATGCGSDDSADPPASTVAVPATATSDGAPAVASTVAAPPDDGPGGAYDNRPPQPDEIDTSTGRPRLCLMVTIDQVNAATGATAVSSQEGVHGDTTTCFVEDAAGEKIISLAGAPAVRFDEASAAADARAVDGLGDGAVWTDGVLHVLMGDEDLAFELRPAAGVDAGAAEAVVEQIAADALSRYEPPPTS